MDEINLHLPGDARAVAASHNLLSAFLDNHLFHGNALNLDPGRIAWPRAMSLSDRALRGGRTEMADGSSPRQAQFVITEASEVMAILALASDRADLRRRLGRILVSLTRDGHPVTAEALKCAGAMAALLNDALWPYLLQTVAGRAGVGHSGPLGDNGRG